MPQDIIIPGYETSIGNKLLAAVDHYGPTSYVLGTGQAYPATSINRGGFDWVDAADFTFDGAFQVNVQYPAAAIGNGTPSVNLRYYYVAGTVNGVTGSGGTGMTPGTYALAFSGGGGSGAAGTITVLTATTFTIALTNAGVGYTSAPTVTAATGGTPPTLTATVATASGTEVANGSNLSTKAIRLLMLAY